MTSSPSFAPSVSLNKKSQSIPDWPHNYPLSMCKF
jgi:hypothetical protein